MKRMIALILAGTLLLSLCACTKDVFDPKEDQQHTGISADKENKMPGSNMQGVGGIQLLADENSPISNHFGTENGYYYLSEADKISGDLYGMYLMYIDYSTKKEVYLCSDSGCRHDSETCSAVLSWEEVGNDSLIFVQGDFLYLLNREYDPDGTTTMNFIAGDDGASVNTESAETSLYRMKPDGSSREKFFTFPENTTTEKIVFGDGNSLWFVTKKISFEQENGARYTTSGERALVQLDLGAKKITKTISLKFDDSIDYDVIGGSGSKFVLSGVEYPNGMSSDEAMRLSDDDFKEMYKNSVTVDCVLDADSGEKKELHRVSNKGDRETFFVADGYLYTSRSEGGIVKTNLETGEEAALTNSLGQNYILSGLSDSLCCVEPGSKEDKAHYFVDMETGEVSRCTLLNQSLGWPLDILCDAGEHVLVIYDYDATPTGDGAYEISKYHYGLISKSDLYNSKASYEPISMVRSGK